MSGRRRLPYGRFWRATSGNLWRYVPETWEWHCHLAGSRYRKGYSPEPVVILGIGQFRTLFPDAPPWDGWPDALIPRSTLVS